MCLLLNDLGSVLVETCIAFLKYIFQVHVKPHISSIYMSLLYPYDQIIVTRDLKKTSSLTDN